MDLLEPMRRASELGCPDFFVFERKTSVSVEKVGFYLASDEPLELPARHLLGGPAFEARINRYAAAVCECWWREYWNAHPLEDHGKMIDLCRAFANEHGR